MNNQGETGDKEDNDVIVGSSWKGGMGRLLKTRGNTVRPHFAVRHKGLSCPLSKERAVVVVLLFLLLLFMIIIIIVIFSASIAKKELRSCYGKWNFGPWTLRPGHFQEEIQEA